MNIWLGSILVIVGIVGGGILLGFLLEFLLGRKA